MPGDDDPKPVLWVSMTSHGRHGADAEHLEQVQQELEETMGDEYNIVVADDKVRLLDAEEIRGLISELQEYAAQFAHEDAMAEAIQGQEGDE